MREHPIPQDVVGYRFHIVGNMTIKQFAEIGAGCIIGFIIYSTNLYDFFKWPLIGLSVGFGALAAFVPFEERPLDHWLATFIKAMYKPTQYFWRREPKIPDLFSYKSIGPQTPVSSLDLKPVRRQRVQEYFGSLETIGPVDPFAAAEQARLSSILETFQTIQVNTVDVQPGQHRPNLVVRTHSLRSRPGEIIEEEVRIDQSTLPPAEYYSPAAETNLTPRQGLAIQQVATNIAIPELETVSVSSPSGVAWERADEPQTADSDRAYSTVSATMDAPAAAVEASINVNLPFPTKPTEPNKLVGMVLTPNNDLINDAIVEIIDANGMVARAIKTNALGQFFVATPLADGTYTITADRDGFSFSPYTITLTGAVVDPLEIRSLI